MKLKKIQFVWWWRWPTVHWWKYPSSRSGYYKYSDKPIFWGLDLGVFELRFWPEKTLKDVDQ